MLVSIINEDNINADLHEDIFLPEPDGRMVNFNRKDLQEKNFHFLLRLKEKFFPVKSGDQDQVLFQFLRTIPAGHKVKQEKNGKRPRKKGLRYEELQLI